VNTRIKCEATNGQPQVHETLYNNLSSMMFCTPGEIISNRFKS
jgi:hypothetical protein